MPKPPTVDLRVLPDHIATDVNLYVEENGKPIGFRALTEYGPICHEGCLAPGSSPHSHATITGYELIYERGIITVRPDGAAIRSTSIHPFPRAS